MLRRSLLKTTTRKSSPSHRPLIEADKVKQLVDLLSPCEVRLHGPSSIMLTRKTSVGVIDADRYARYPNTRYQIPPDAILITCLQMNGWFRPEINEPVRIRFHRFSIGFETEINTTYDAYLWTPVCELLLKEDPITQAMINLLGARYLNSQEFTQDYIESIRITWDELDSKLLALSLISDELRFKE